MLVITGIGRCGTSLVTKWLKDCGLSVGSNKWFDVYDAGLENRQTLDINNRLLNYYVKGEDVNLHHVRGDIEDLNFDAVKSTQFLTHPALITEWLNVRDDLHIIWMHREPKDIVQSVYRVPEWNTPVYRTRVDLIEKKCEEFKEAIGDDWEQFMFPGILQAPELLIDEVSKSFELPDDAEEIWNELLDGRQH